MDNCSNLIYNLWNITPEDILQPKYEIFAQISHCCLYSQGFKWNMVKLPAEGQTLKFKQVSNWKSFQDANLQFSYGISVVYMNMWSLDFLRMESLQKNLLLCNWFDILVGLKSFSGTFVGFGWTTSPLLNLDLKSKYFWLFVRMVWFFCLPEFLQAALKGDLPLLWFAFKPRLSDQFRS